MRNVLLTIDGVVNLVLGILLVVFPSIVVLALGLPAGESKFYANILGGVLFGVGVALLIEQFRPLLKSVGLGLAGAICINLCGGVVLAAWLALGRLKLTTIGVFTLWGLALLLVGLSLAELYGHLKRQTTTT